MPNVLQPSRLTSFCILFLKPATIVRNNLKPLKVFKHITNWSLDLYKVSTHLSLPANIIIFTTGKNYNDFVVCSIKENIEFICQKVTPNQHLWDTVLPKLTNFWRFCVLPEILGRWYTQKRNITLKQCDAGAVCFCRNETETGEAVVHCSNTACPISSCHLSCLKLMGVPKNCAKKGSPPQKPKRHVRWHNKGNCQTRHSDLHMESEGYDKWN